jgi:hypothetical protein
VINDGINNVPDKTIAVFTAPKTKNKNLTNERVLGMLKPSSKKRDWFDSHFYRCLPLSIGNQYGFTLSLEFDFEVIWNGGTDKEDTLVSVNKKDFYNEDKYPNISSHFGHGIFTINAPFVFRTPPGINLMTINPPNHILPNITPMTGVIETDNLRNNFSFNLKIQSPGIKTYIPAGTPVGAFIPIPRYFADDFKIKFAEDLFEKEIVEEEINYLSDFGNFRETVEPTLKNKVNNMYLFGKDIYGNKFKDHQKK